MYITKFARFFMLIFSSKFMTIYLWKGTGQACLVGDLLLSPLNINSFVEEEILYEQYFEAMFHYTTLLFHLEANPTMLLYL